MSRLINDDELKKSIHEKTLFSKWQKVLIETVINDQPTVDAVPVVHGEWKKEGRWSRGRMYRCDQCGNYLDFNGLNAGRGDANYCPNCGADMRGEQDG